MILNRLMKEVLPGANDDEDHDEGEGEAGEAGRDDGAGAEQEGVLVVAATSRSQIWHCHSSAT